MKTFKKILIALCVLAVITSAAVVAVLAAGGTVEEAMTKVQAYNAAADTEAKRTAYAELVEYVGTVDTGADGYDSLMTAMTPVHADYAKNVLVPDIQTKQAAAATDHRYADLVEAYEALATMKEQHADAMDDELEKVLTDTAAALDGYASELITAYSSCTTFSAKAHSYAILQALVSAWPISAEDTTTTAAYAALQQTYEQDLAAAKKAYYSNATYEMYTNSKYTSYQFHHTFDELAAPPTDMVFIQRGDGNGGSIVRDQNVVGNRYLTMRWKTNQPSAGGTSAHTYMEPVLDLTLGGVIEFDMTTFGIFPDINIEAAEGPNTDRQFTKLFQFFQQADGTVNLQTFGKVESGTAAPYYTAKDVIVPGQWTHFAFVFHADTNKMDLYINYELVYTFDAYNKYGISHLRMGLTTKERELSMDNFFVYSGAAPRDVEMLEKMSNAQKFSYYSSVVADESEAPANRNSAYTLAGELLPLFWSEEGGYLGAALDDAELQAAVNTVTGFDYNALLDKLKVENLETLVAKLAEYDALPRTLGGLTARANALVAMESFVEENVFDTASTDFVTQNARVSAFRAEYDNDVACNSFLTSMDRFAASPSLTGMKRYYANAQTSYLAMDLGTQFDDAAENQRLAEAIAAYRNAEASIAVVEQRNNAKRFHAVLNNIRTALQKDNWQEDALLKSYVSSARQILREGNYDHTYEGLDTLMPYYETANAYFWPLLQAEHVAYIESRLTDFASASAYIERLGILRSIGYYIETDSNEVDQTNAAIALLVSNYNTCMEELKIQEDRYVVLLQENTEKFVNLMHIIAATEGYSNLKPLYDRAAALYFSMNISPVTDADGNVKFTLDEVKACISAFDALTVALDRVALASDLFIANAAKLTGEGAEALSVTETYRVLVECYRYVDEVDTSYEGAAAAMETYTAALSAYNATIAPLSGEIASTVELSVSARALCGMKALMAAIRELMP